MPNILLICTANQIRSPLAEAILRKLLADRGLSEAYSVASAGTWAMDNEPPLTKAILVGQEYGVDISGHRSRMVNREMLENADLVLTMENRQKEALRYEFPENQEKIQLLTEMVGEALDIQDPVSGDFQTYQTIGQQIYQVLDEGLDELLHRA
jgi:protein-tyrosine-phosphatase